MNDYKFLELEHSSFRDHSSTIFYYNEMVLRRVKKKSFNIDNFLNSNFYKSHKKNIIETTVLDLNKIDKSDQKIIDLSNFYWLEHSRINNILYPYEFCFNQLKDAAILYLDLLISALENNFDMSDASAYNFQMYKGKLVLIDLTSFIDLNDNNFFIPHKQFCENFLAPLSISSFTGIEFNNLFKSNINGVDLKIASKILPLSSYFNYQLLTNIHLHNFFNSKISSSSKKKIKENKNNFLYSKKNKIHILNNFKNFINKLKFKKKTYWSNYSSDNSYNSISEINKKKMVSDFLKNTKTKSLIDIGCNDGEYSKLAYKIGVNQIMSVDNDMSSLNQLYEYFKNQSLDFNCVYQDFLNPSSNIGWLNLERKSFEKRYEKKFDSMICLAFIHHICIKNNVPIIQFVDYFFKFSKNILIEFVPKDDPMVKSMLEFKPNIAEDYNIDNFRKILQKSYTIEYEIKIEGSLRTMFYIKKNS